MPTRSTCLGGGDPARAGATRRTVAICPRPRRDSSSTVPRTRSISSARISAIAGTPRPARRLRYMPPTDFRVPLDVARPTSSVHYLLLDPRGIVRALLQRLFDAAWRSTGAVRDHRDARRVLRGTVSVARRDDGDSRLVRLPISSRRTRASGRLSSRRSSARFSSAPTLARGVLSARVPPHLVSPVLTAIVPTVLYTCRVPHVEADSRLMDTRRGLDVPSVWTLRAATDTTSPADRDRAEGPRIRVSAPCIATARRFAQLFRPERDSAATSVPRGRRRAPLSISRDALRASRRSSRSPDSGSSSPDHRHRRGDASHSR